MSHSHYPDFDVMSQVDAWDPHTQSVVMQRLKGPHQHKTLTEHEAKLLLVLASHLLYEDRDEILAFVLAHIDDRVSSKVGESQREQHVPPEADLLRWGLTALDAMAGHVHGKAFLECDTQHQFELIAQLQRGEWDRAELSEHAGLPQKALFKKVLALTVEAYVSHPEVWSEMGYAGPAYPRGYYRIERGVTDPWEPRRDANGARE